MILKWQYLPLQIYKKSIHCIVDHMFLAIAAAYLLLIIVCLYLIICLINVMISVRSLIMLSEIFIYIKLAFTMLRLHVTDVIWHCFTKFRFSTLVSLVVYKILMHICGGNYGNSTEKGRKQHQFEKPTIMYDTWSGDSVVNTLVSFFFCLQGVSTTNCQDVRVSHVVKTLIFVVFKLSHRTGWIHCMSDLTYNAPNAHTHIFNT